MIPVLKNMTPPHPKSGSFVCPCLGDQEQDAVIFVDFFFFKERKKEHFHFLSSFSAYFPPSLPIHLVQFLSYSSRHPLPRNHLLVCRKRNNNLLCGCS